MNSMDLGYLVMVISGRQRINGEKTDYIYFGLDVVTKCWRQRGLIVKYMFMFEH